LAFGLATAATAQNTPQARITLRGHVTPAIQSAQAVGSVASNQPIQLALTLPLRNQSGLKDLLRGLYDPGDPRYGKYLTPAEFTERFGPTQADYDAAASFARQHGLTVTGTFSSRTVLDVKGPAAAVQAAFGVGLVRLQGVDGRIIYAPDREPSVPSSIGKIISGVVGLDDAVRLHSNIHPVTPYLTNSILSPMVIGTGPNFGLSPGDIRIAYGLNGAANGVGQTLGVVAFSSFLQSDISNYGQAFHLPTATIQSILVDGGPVVTGGSTVETTLDIELQLALAQGATVLVYEAPNNTTNILDCYTKIASDNQAKSISTSWGVNESSLSASFLAAENTIFQQMAAQGQSMFAAAGDFGAYDDGSTLSVEDPASQPWVTGVGSTDLTTSSRTYVSESAVGHPLQSPAGLGGGGGISSIWGIPSYQIGAISTDSLGSNTMRNVPDVSIYGALNTGGYSIYVNGRWSNYGGSSAAVSLWAGLGSMVNQMRGGQTNPIGFLNPAIYQLGMGANYQTYFHDVSNHTTNLYFPAVTGYDLATGWGSPKGTQLIGALSTIVTAPQYVTATAGDKSVTLNWKPGSGASSYNVYRSYPPGDSNLYLLASGVTGTSYTNAGNGSGTALVPGVTYYYAVASVFNGKISAQSDRVSATPFGAPSKPSISSITAADGQVTLKWGGSPGATGYDIYQGTEAGGEGTTPIAPGVTDSSYVITGLTNGKTYYFQVTATNAWGTSPSSNEVSATPNPPPTTPVDLVAVPGNATIALSWSPSTAATAYNIYRTTNGPGTEGTAIYKLRIPTTSFTDTNLVNGITYYYTVAAYSPIGTSAQSVEASAMPLAPPAAPIDLNAKAGADSVNLTWQAAARAASYNIYRGTTADGEDTTPVATGVTNTSFTDNSVTDGTRYFYKVAAVNVGGTSSLSSEAAATPLAGPDTPDGLRIYPGNSKVTLYWNTSIGAIRYNVYRGTSPGTEDPTPIATGLLGGPYSAYIDSTVSNGTTYYYTVAGVNSVAVSAQSAEVSATPLDAPAAPTNLSATAGNTLAVLKWTAVPGATSYRIFRSTSPGVDNTATFGASLTDTTYSDVRLANDTTYYYRVAAASDFGMSPLSNEVSVKPIAIPAIPASLSATPSVSKIILSWPSAASATSYNVYRSTTSGGEGTTALKTGIGGTSYSDTTTVNGTTYYYTVAAVNTNGTSAQSVEASATPQTPPTFPHGLTATAGDGQITLAWTASAGTTSYNVLRGTTSGGESATPIATGITGTSYVNTGLTNGTAYYYKMTATGPTGTSTASTEAHATPYLLVRPTTSAAFSGTPGNSPWYVSTVQVTLTAAADTFPLANTYYTLDGGSPVIYSAPFTVADGTHTITYWSVDNAGNAEVAHTQTIKIDTLAPATTASVTGTTVKLTPSDAISGISSTLYTIDGGTTQTYTAPLTITAYGSHTVTYYSIDAAGNTEPTNTQNITISYPPPTITSRLPASTTAGGPAFTFKINGTGFTAATTVMFGGFAVTPATQTSTLLTMTVPAADFTTPGDVTVTVANPSPGGGSASAVFTVSPPTLLLTSFAPSSVAGGASTTGRVQLTGPAPAGGLVVTISSSDPSVMTLPSSTVTVPAGSLLKIFTVTTHAVPSTQSPVITATYGDVTKTATLTVTGP